MQEAPALGELKAAALNPRAAEQVSQVRFSPSEELLWAGTEAGSLFTLRIPEVERYSSVRAHQHRISDVVPLPPSVSNGALSLSADTVRYHSSGGLPHFTYTDEQGKDLTSCALDPQSSQKAILGRMSGTMSVLDVQTGQLADTAGAKLEGIIFIRAPALRGAVAVGCASGQVSILDPRNGFKAEQVVSAHAGGLVAMDVAAGLMATSGLGTRQGHMVPDTIVKVYDLRSTARVMTTLPFSAGPALLRFHPRYSGTLLIASTSGAFTLSQTPAMGYAPLVQVDTEGDLMTSVDFSSSGECLAFGGTGGFVHLWCYNQGPRVNLRSGPLEIPPAVPEPYLSLDEDDSFAAILPHYPTEGRALSEWESSLMGKSGLPPRVVNLGLLNDIKQVDFVTYIPNPHFRRDKPRGEAARLIAALRNKRLEPRLDTMNWLSNGQYASQGSADSLLPAKYRRVHITVDIDRRYEEFDFAKCNRTRFAGLENGIANCYANALIQVLYFIPGMRAALLATMPDPEREFSLLDELALLFRMLASESGHACQATNLLRALRQSREATGLGLLEGHAQKGAHGADIEVEANKDRSLSRRIQSLQRFLLDKLHHEVMARQPQPSAVPHFPAMEGPSAPSSGLGAPEAAKSTPASPSEEENRASSDASAQPGGGGEEVRNVPGETSGQTSIVEQVFGIRMLQRMQSLQGARRVSQRETRCFQVDLQYPRRNRTAPASPQPKASPQKAGALPAGPEAGAEPRPSFSDILVASLEAESETRAWFSDELKYQYVRQTRTPLNWPQVLALGTGLQDRSSLSWWQPALSTQPTMGPPDKQPWAPWTLSLEIEDGKMSARQADTPEELQLADDSSAQRAVYELTAVVALVQDEDTLLAQEQGKPVLEEGHLIAHVRVPASYLDREVGLLPTPRAQPVSPGFTPTTFFRPAHRFEPAPSLPEDPFEGFQENRFGEDPSQQAQEKAGAAAEHGLPEDPFGDEVQASSPSSDALVEPDGRSRRGAEASPRSAHPDAGNLPDLSLIPGGSPSAEDAEAEQPMSWRSEAGIEGPQLAPSAEQTGNGDGTPAVPNQQQMTLEDPLPEQFTTLKVSAERMDSLSRSGRLRRAGQQEPTWLLINDFSISPTSKSEVLQLFGGHKLPCLLYYTQVSVMQQETRQDFQAVPVPVLTHEAFHQLCRAPPLQVSLLGLSRLAGPSFWPLAPEEGPQEGLLLGLDAEFVAFSPPTKAFRGGVEIETAPSRLGLARVSVLRGEGPQAGKACIDDYIRATEPVYDYLTQYSGLQPGDLDPTMSQHHLTTTKAAYLKLRFLVDTGCVFVGHGLKKDFRMINVVVPSAQVIDTVDLFYLKKQRKLSLRFLAAYLLRHDIQQVTHDSVEDARTALNLYRIYLKLEAEGRLREVLQGMYAWGKQHGWDPQALREHPASDLPSPGQPH